MKNKEAEVRVRIPANACSLEIPVEYPNILYQTENPKYNLEFYSYRLKLLYYNKLVILTCSNIFNQKNFFFLFFRGF